MKSSLLLASLVAIAPTAAFAHHQPLVRETCKAYRHTETYKPGHYLPNGIWVSGRVVRGQVEIPCSSYGTPAPVVAHHPHYHHDPAPVVSSAPTVVQQPVAQAPVARCEGKLARMGVGGVLGGIAGRYAVGGKKSDKTILGTTIGAVAGSLVGAATC